MHRRSKEMHYGRNEECGRRMRCRVNNKGEMDEVGEKVKRYEWDVEWRIEK